MSPPCCLIKCRLDGLSVSEKEMSRRNKKKQTSANKNTRRTNMKWDDTRWKWIWDEYDKERKETILWESRRRGRDRLIDWKGWMILLVSLSTLLLFSPSFILSILSTTIPRAIPYGSEEAQAGKEVSLIILQLLWIPRAITDSQSVHSSSSFFFFSFLSFHRPHSPRGGSPLFPSRFMLLKGSSFLLFPQKLMGTFLTWRCNTSCFWRKHCPRRCPLQPRRWWPSV